MQRAKGGRLAGAEIGVAVIGTGRAGMIHAGNFKGRISGARLTALVDTNEGALRDAARELAVERTYTDVGAALQDSHVNAVVVVTPTNLHRDIVVAAAAAGRHVFCEKPMAMNAGESRQMIEACERAGVVLQIGFMRRFDRSFRAAKAAIDNGEIGEVVQVKSLTHGPSVPQRWMYDIRASNGPLAEVSSHDIDTLRWLTGSEFLEVHSLAANFRCPEARTEYPDFYDTILLSARFENGNQGLIDGAVSVGYGYDARTEVLGTKGNLLIGSLEADSVRICGADGRLVQAATRSWRDLFAEAYLAEDEEFVSAIVDERDPAVTGKDGLEAVRVVNAGNLSILGRRPVRLDEV